MGGITISVDPISKFKTQPYKHQLECLNQFGRREYFALLADPGTGKTWIIINNIADLWSSNECDVALVLAPNGVHSNWTRIEIIKHMPDWVRYDAADWAASPTKAEKEHLNTLFSHVNPGNLRILTMNWEALQTKRGFEAAERFVCSGRQVMIVCDESDAIKNPSAARTKALMKLRKYSYWRRIMTGTPVNQAPFDLFSQFTFLDDGILGTSSYWAFKAEYAELLQENNPLMVAIKRQNNLKHTPQIVAKGPGGRPKYRNLDKLSALIAPHSFRVLKKDCLDLPEKIYKTVMFDMTPTQRDVYEKAKVECRIVFEGESSPFTKLVAVTKLAQITSGYYIHPAAEDPVRIEGTNPKLDLLVERVKALTQYGEKVIVWARFRIEIADIVKRLRAEKLWCVEYHGGVSKQDREKAIDSFEDGEAQVFVGNQQAGGLGITLVAASYVCYFSNDFSLRHRLQSEDRAHRIGQTKNVTYINFVAKRTVDEFVVRALSSKEDVSDAILNGMKF